MGIGENLRRLRGAKGWTQHELARRAGIKLAHISTLEKPDANPKLETILSLMEALGCTANDLIRPATISNLSGSLKVSMEAVATLPARDKLLVIQLIDKVLVASKLRHLYESVTPADVLAQELKDEQAEDQWLLLQAAHEEDEEQRLPPTGDTKSEHAA